MALKFPRILLGGRTDIGVVREENQDALLMHRPTDPAVLQRKGTLVVLADGMGGLEGGRTASRLAVEAFRKSYYESPSEPRSALEEAVREANLAIYRHARDFEGGRQMGSTLTALALVGRKAFIAQVGDSRAYRFRDGSLQLLTRDHSLARELADRGEIGHPTSFYRNILTRGLGLKEEVAPDLYEVDDLRAGETFVLTSDGLHGLVEEDEIVSSLERFRSNLDGACDELVDLAKSRGGPDNITIALAHVEDLPSSPASADPYSAAGLLGRVFDRRGRAIAFLAIGSFAAGVLLTLFVQESASPRQPRLDRAANEVDNALRADADSKAPEVRARELREALERVRRALER